MPRTGRGSRLRSNTGSSRYSGSSRCSRSWTQTATSCTADWRMSAVMTTPRGSAWSWSSRTRSTTGCREIRCPCKDGQRPVQRIGAAQDHLDVRLLGEVPFGGVVGVERFSGVGEDRDALVQGALLMVEHDEELRQFSHRGLLRVRGVQLVHVGRCTGQSVARPAPSSADATAGDTIAANSMRGRCRAAGSGCRGVACVP